MDQHPLKLVITRRGVWWPLPFAAFSLAMSIGVFGWFVFSFATFPDFKFRYLIWIPLFVVAIIASLRDVRAHVRWLVDYHRSRRNLAAGLCARCGYRLTGNTSGVCPECGTSAGLLSPPPVVPGRRQT